MKRVALTITIALCTASVAQAQVASQTPRDDLWAPNKDVVAAREHNGKIYLTGAFTKIGKPIGGFVVTDPISGSTVQRLGSIEGEIEIIEPDGTGGWWVGGIFRLVHGEQRGGIVHILNDGSLSAWNPGFGNSTSVLDIAAYGNTLYVSGSFGFMKLDALTAQQLAWTPNINVNPKVFEVFDDILIVAGAFSTVGGEPRGGLVAFSAKTGALLPWNPITNGDVKSARVQDGMVYIAGRFDLPNNPVASLARIASIDLVTGEPGGLDVTVNGGRVEMLAVSGSTVYAGGSFTEIGGVARTRIVAIDAVTNVVSNWAPVLTSGGGGVPRVQGISADSNRVYLVGEFEKVDGENVGGAASFDIATGDRNAWNPGLGSHTARDVYTTGQSVAVCGSFKIVNAVDRNYVAAIDLTTGLPTAFHPVVGPNETAILPADDTVYIGTGLFNAETGAPDPDFSLTVMDFVSRLYRVDETLYAVGSGAGGSGLFAMDAASGDFRWTLECPERVNILAGSADGRFLYIAGGFGSVAAGNLVRPGIAEIDTMKHQFTDWSPDLSRGANGVCAVGNRIYVSGDFSTVNNRPQNGLAVFEVTDEKTRTLSSIDAGLDDAVAAITPFGELLYMYGSFRNIGTGWRMGIAAINSSSAALCTWDLGDVHGWSPFPDAGPTTLILRSSGVNFGTTYRPYIAVLDIIPGQACK